VSGCTDKKANNGTTAAIKGKNQGKKNDRRRKWDRRHHTRVGKVKLLKWREGSKGGGGGAEETSPLHFKIGGENANQFGERVKANFVSRRKQERFNAKKEIFTTLLGAGEDNSLTPQGSRAGQRRIRGKKSMRFRRDLREITNHGRERRGAKRGVNSKEGDEKHRLAGLWLTAKLIRGGGGEGDWLFKEKKRVVNCPCNGTRRRKQDLVSTSPKKKAFKKGKHSSRCWKGGGGRMDLKDETS